MPHPKDISIRDFTYELPAEKIALFPLDRRDESKLLICKSGQIREDRFKHIDQFLDSNSLLVVNTTKVIRARLQFLNEKDQSIELFCLEPSGNTELTLAMGMQGRSRWNCLAGHLKKWKNGDLHLKHGDLTLYAKLLARKDQHVEIEFYWTPPELAFSEVLGITGHIPIPPYLKREDGQADAERYQTIYANTEGSVAAPTAGLHFTEQVLEKLSEKNITRLPVTLHVGAGTFRPVKAGTMSEHDMHAEWIDVPLVTLKALRDGRGKPVIAVGTTSLRTLESLYWMGLKAFHKPAAELAELETGQWDPYEPGRQLLQTQESLDALIRWMESRGLERLVCHTQILIAPPYELKVAGGLITNFHQPQSTLLLLVSAVVGNKWREIYTYALEHDFRFLSYGDSSLLLK